MCVNINEQIEQVEKIKNHIKRIEKKPRATFLQHTILLITLIIVVIGNNYLTLKQNKQKQVKKNNEVDKFYRKTTSLIQQGLLQ